ncbi:hypothetical protein CEXT_476231 [Caerostris extrusa]|uniref:Uncharacterized protein n=1 Tax=Caerostris extrusa TaxID=172846 RepID=A0AAV4THT2_CAEEX|nr:hypothetical protein CEXT_476231 [Caerostris extrusa]
MTGPSLTEENKALHVAGRKPIRRRGIALRNQCMTDALLVIRLISDVSKKSSLDSELKHTAFATIHECFPDDSWLHVYGDGSAAESI